MSKLQALKDPLNGCTLDLESLQRRASLGEESNDLTSSLYLDSYQAFITKGEQGLYSFFEKRITSEPHDFSLTEFIKQVQQYVQADEAWSLIVTPVIGKVLWDIASPKGILKDYTLALEALILLNQVNSLFGLIL